MTIIEHGVNVGKNLDYFMVKINGESHRFLANTLKKIIILNSFSITKSAILLAMFNNVNIMALSSHGSPLFSILPLRTEDRFLNLLLKGIRTTDFQRTKLSRQFVENSIKGKLAFLRYKKGIFKRTDKKKYANMLKTEEMIMSAWNECKKVRGRYADKKQGLLGIESHAANAYFSTFSMFFKKTEWTGRRDKDGKDLVNMCLNYSYGVLKFHIYYSLIDAGINPFSSVYHHQEGKAKMFIVFDVMEGLRHTVCDWVVHSLIRLGKIKPSDIIDGTISLEKRALIASETLRMIELKSKQLKKTMQSIKQYC